MSPELTAESTRNLDKPIPVLLSDRSANKHSVELRVPRLAGQTTFAVPAVAKPYLGQPCMWMMFLFLWASCSKDAFCSVRWEKSHAQYLMTPKYLTQLPMYATSAHVSSKKKALVGTACGTPFGPLPAVGPRLETSGLREDPAEKPGQQQVHDESTEERGTIVTHLQDEVQVEVIAVLIRFGQSL